MKSSETLIRNGWRGWIVLLLAWTLPPLVVSVSFQLVPGQSKAFWRFLCGQLVFYYSLAIACPLVYRLTVPEMFSARTWPTAVGTQIAMAAGVSAFVLITMTAYDLASGATEQSLFTPGPGELLSRFNAFNATYMAFITLFNYALLTTTMVIIRFNRQRAEELEHQRKLKLKTSRLEVLLSDARLTALQAQLQPHFLFNALNSVSALIETKRNDDASIVVSRLADLLRATLAAPNSKTIPLGQELEMVVFYLEIERVRFSDRLRVEINIDDALLKLEVPPLILQPLVENSIRHAVMKDLNAHLLRIVASSANSSLHIEVRDDGPGFPAQWSFETDAGVGLKNLRDRLQTLYGDESRITIEAVTPTGAAVRLHLPLRPGDSP